MKTQTKSRFNAKRLSLWAALSGVLITLGFIMDGSTEIGHHAFLILGGVAVGIGAVRESRIGLMLAFLAFANFAQADEADKILAAMSKGKAADVINYAPPVAPKATATPAPQAVNPFDVYYANGLLRRNPTH